MRTFSLNDISGADAYAALVWGTIQSNLGYFKKFNGERWQEAVHKTYLTSLEHRDSAYGDNILPYIKKLARTILMVKSNESAFSVTNDEGEIHHVFSVLQDSIDADNFDGSDELMDVLKELYLLDSESFMKFKNLYLYDDISDVDSLKEIRIRNKTMSFEFRKLVEKYGADFTFKVLYEFFKELPVLTRERVTSLTKEVVLGVGNFSLVEKIPDTPLIIDSKNKYHYIDKNTLTMDKNPDYFSWDIVGSSLCDILRIDISDFMMYMYEEVYVDEGVSTRHLAHCGGKLRLTTPGGVPHIGLDRDKFLSAVRVELILNLMANNIGSIVALSPDNIYIKQTKSFHFDRIRFRFKTGRLIDAPVHLHIKKRRR